MPPLNRLPRAEPKGAWLTELYPKITLRGAGVQQPNDRHFDIAVEAMVEVNATAAKRAATAWLFVEAGNMLIEGSPT